MKLCTVFRTLLFVTVPFFGALRVLHSAEIPADLIIHNAKVISVNSSFALGQAIGVRGDKIIAVGKDKQLEPFHGPNTRMIDAHGATVMPGLYDSDVDSYAATVSELTSTTPKLNSLAEAFKYIREQAAHKPTNSWITIDHVYPTRVTEGRLPTKAELDAAAPNHPVYWNCGPLVMLNSKALQISKITSATTNPPGGEIVFKSDSVEPSGLLRNAAELVKIPPTRPPAAEQTRAALKQLYQSYNQQGITSICESDAEPAAIDLFRDLSQSDELTVRIHCMRPIDPAPTIDESLARLNVVTNAAHGKLPYGPTGVGDNWVRIGALKCRLDGDVLTGSAYLRAPWGIGPTYGITEPSYRGNFFEESEVLPDLFLKAIKQGWQLSADCTGDACLDQVLNSFEKVQFKTDIRQGRFIINHASFQAAQDWTRCRDLGVAASLQPAWLYFDGDSLEKTLGDHRLKNFIAAKSWLTNGVTIGMGSSHFAKLDSATAINSWSPWLGMETLLTRQASSGAEIHPEEALDRANAIRCYTINNAYLGFEENNRGSLELGKLADLIMIDTDILKCPVNQVRDTKVLLTMVGGKIVWEAK
ncbi:MAG TPA: amidohydrolase [Verrucomicrobiae bacterium]|jgi:hypothetical protein|nr:amidohydrolase [Verrucomicrobiae bacterium]